MGWMEGWLAGWLAGWMDDGMNGNAVRVVWPWPSTMDDAETLSVREPGNGSIAVTSLMNFGNCVLCMDVPRVHTVLHYIIVSTLIAAAPGHHLTSFLTMRALPSPV
jgi:hypothetical protein